MKRNDYGRTHYIQTFKGGSVVRVLNRDSHGHPLLRFKKLQLVCESEDVEKHHSENGQRNSDEDDDSFDSMTLKELMGTSKKKKRKHSFDSPKRSIHGATTQLKEDVLLDEPLSFKVNLPTKPRTKSKTIAKPTSTSCQSWISVDAATKEIHSLSSSQGTVDVHGPFDKDAGTMKLGMVDSSHNYASCLSVNISYHEEQFAERPERANGSLLTMEESLFSSEATLNCMLNNASHKYTDPEGSLLSKTSGKNPEEITIVETWRPQYTDSLNTFHFADSSTSESTVSMSYRGGHFDNMPENPNGGLLKFKGSGVPCEETSIFLVNEVSDGCMEPEEPSLSTRTSENCEGSESDETLRNDDMDSQDEIQFADSSTSGLFVNTSYMGEDFKEIVSFKTSRSDYMDSQNVLNLADNSSSDFSLGRSYDEEVIGEMLGGANRSVLKMAESSSSSIETSTLLVNEVLNGCIEAAEPCISAGTTENMEGLSEVGVPEIRQSIQSCVSQHLKDANIIRPVLCCCSTEATVVINSSPFEKCPSFEQDEFDRIVPDSDDEGGNTEDEPNIKPAIIESQAFAITLQTADLVNSGESEDANHTSSDIEANSINTSTCDDDSLTAEQGRTSLVISDTLFAPHVTSEGLLDVRSFDSTKSLKDVDALDKCSYVATENPPKNLLSSRKAISPNSQEKLCWNLNTGDLPDKEILTCREKLVFKEQTVCKNPLLKTCAEGVDVSMIPGQIKKVVNNKSASPQVVLRSILKRPTTSTAKLTSSTEYASEGICAQKAIEFSQRQMQDIESVTLNLMKGLVTMKDIVEDIVCSQDSQTQPSKYTSRQMKSTIGNVIAAEGTTKKWLTMMSRDCTRFCKIMESSKLKSSLTSGNEVHKKKKNITSSSLTSGNEVQKKNRSSTFKLP